MIAMSPSVLPEQKGCHISWNTYLNLEDKSQILTGIAETHEVRRLLESAVLRSFT
jgi:hypothetical protein